jgi:hypothetical protein
VGLVVYQPLVNFVHLNTISKEHFGHSNKKPFDTFCLNTNRNEQFGQRLLILSPLTRSKRTLQLEQFQYPSESIHIIILHTGHCFIFSSFYLVFFECR